MKTLKIIAFILTVIGAINWGLVGIFRFDLVASLFGEMSMITRITYTLVGISGIMLLLCAYDMFSDEV